MEFGRVQKHQLESVDFTLPEDIEADKKITGTKRDPSFKIHIGLPRWNNPGWKGKLYPANAKDAALLSYYAASFDCIELNATWYKTPSLQTIQSWKNLVKRNEDFLFCPKMVKNVTHAGSLVDNRNLSDHFIETVRHLDHHLGAIFIQLNESFSPARKNELFSYLQTLPDDLSFFLEVRHPQWFAGERVKQELFSFLEDNHIGIIITDTAGRRDAAHMRLTVPKTFIRFAGNSLHTSDYTRIDDWVNRIKAWMDNGIEEIFFFMHMHDEALVPELTTYLIGQLNKICSLQIRMPQLKNDELSQLSLF